MSKVVLVVEDEPNNQKLIRDLLQILGCETIAAANGKQGVELARAKKPDLILMDIMMPVMDGLEATRILKADEATKGIPILALTSYAMKDDEARVLQAGCDEYLTKPIDIRKFKEKIKEYMP